MSRSVERRLHIQQEHAKCISCRAEVDEVEGLRELMKALRYVRRVLHGSLCQEMADCVDACEEAGRVLGRGLKKAPRP